MKTFLNEKERKWISELNSKDRDSGYNIASGGEGRDDISDEEKARLREINCIPVYRYSLTGIFIEEFESLTDAATVLNCTKSTILSACKKKSIISNKSIWFYKHDFSEEKLKFTIDKLKNRKQYGREKVVQLSKDDNFIKVFDTITKAAEILKIDRSHIVKACKNKIKSCGGYKWMYYDDYKNLLNT